jgi:ATP-dependent DNA ligase
LREGLAPRVLERTAPAPVGCICGLGRNPRGIILGKRRGGAARPAGRRFEQLCHWVRDELVERAVILDGEVVALDEHGRQDFRLLMRGGETLHYVVFDVLWLKGKDLRECPLRRRKRILSRLVTRTSTVLSPVFHVRGRGRDLFGAVQRLDLEGIVAKRLADAYTPDTMWRKIRNGEYTQMPGRGELFHPPHR